MATGLTSEELANIFDKHLQRRVEDVQSHLQGTANGENPTFHKEYLKLQSEMPSDMKQFEGILVYISCVSSAILDTIVSNNQALSKSSAPSDS